MLSYNKLLKRLALLGTLFAGQLLFAIVIKAQANGDTSGTIVNQQIWIDFYPHYYLNDKIEYYGDAGFRTTAGEKSWSRIYARPSLRYHFASIWEFHGGIGFFYIFNKLDINRFEITPWQGIQANWPKIGIVSFKHLCKIEERFSYLSKSESNSFDLRLRYKLSGKINFKNKGNTLDWYVPFYMELFYPINNQIEELYRNKGRAGAGLGFKANREWDFSLLFNWQTSRAGPEDQLHVSDFAYQLKIKKRWNKN